jgi:hypothetical protein
VYYWAKKDIWSPEFPNGRPKLWSYSDLLALRLINWLRQAKPDYHVPATGMREIRRLLDSVQDFGDQLESDSVRVWVESDGAAVLQVGEEVSRPLGRGLRQPTLVHNTHLLLAAFEHDSIRGPDLSRPRPSLRIIPGKVSSEVHAENTRVTSPMIKALSERGIRADGIQELYPFLSPGNIADALSLEAQLEQNLAA